MMQESLKNFESQSQAAMQQFEKNDALTQQKIEFLEKENRALAERNQTLQNENAKFIEKISV